MQNSLETYTMKYNENGYGLLFPDGHVVRFYERILKYKLNKINGNLLDFGCGNGVHSAYFQSKGFKTFGIDIVPSLKEIWEQNIRGGDIVKLWNQILVSKDFLMKIWISSLQIKVFTIYP